MIPKGSLLRSSDVAGYITRIWSREPRYRRRLKGQLLENQAAKLNCVVWLMFLVVVIIREQG